MVYDAQVSTWIRETRMSETFRELHFWLTLRENHFLKIELSLILTSRLFDIREVKLTQNILTYERLDCFLTTFFNFKFKFRFKARVSLV